MMEYNRVNIRTWSLLGSRRVLGLAMADIASKYDNFTFLTADVGRYYNLKKLEKDFPKTIFNAGIAEQNMIGMAAGMAKEGFMPYVATYATFATARVLDQVRVSMGLMRLPIKLIGVSAGLAEGDMSATHMGLEDIADIRAIPEITILSPADCTETVKALEASASYPGPIYIRLSGRENAPIVYNNDYNFQIGKGIVLTEGNDIAILATGATVYNALRAAKTLQSRGISCSVVDIHTIRPLDTELIDRMANSHRCIVTVEEHSICGGLGSAVAEVLIARKKTIPHQLIIGTRDYKNAMDYKALQRVYGVDAEGIADTIEKNMEE